MDSGIIIENALDAIITVEVKNGRIASWNPAAETLFGCPAESVVGKYFSDIIITQPINDNNILPESREETFKINRERSIRHLNGEVVPIEFSISHVFIGERKIYVIFAREISQRWYREKKLQHSYQNQRIMNSILNVSLMSVSLEAQLELILDLILSIPTIKLLSTGAFLLVDETRLILEVKVSRGFSAQQLNTCKAVPFGKCHCGRAAQTGEVQFVECIDEGHDFIFDKMKPHGHYCVPILSGEQVLGVIALYIEEGHRASKLEIDTLMAIANVVAGIIDRKNMDRQLVELVSDLKQTISSLDDEKKFNDSIIGSFERGLLVLDKAGRIEKVNPAGERLLAALFDHRHPEGEMLSEVFCAEVASRLISSHGSDNQDSEEFTVVTPDNKKHIVGYNTMIREDAFGEELGKIISLSDITGVRKLQAEMEKMNRLSTIAEIASAVAHEVRNPLAGIKTMAQVIDEQIEHGDTRKEYIGRIIKQVDRLNKMLTEFFTYARPSTPEQRKLALPRIISEVKPLVQSRLTKRGIVLREEYPDGLPNILVDPNQAQQVFLNLFFNAIDAIRHGGEITIEAEYIGTDRPRFGNQRFSWLREGGRYVMVSFTDNGCGMTDEVLENVFEPFFTTKHDGTGLGLPIVFRILKENNAGFYIDNKREKGTRILMFFIVE